MRFAHAAAAATIVGAAAHLAVAALTLGASPIASTVLVGMAGWCLACGRELWRSDSTRCWRRVVAGGAAMLALHALVMIGPIEHHHGAELGGLMNTALGVTVVAEFLVLAGFVRRARLPVSVPR